ncbi:hypothetical protein PMAC_002996 [Pneumocystis sp. 'macacae']|nr:hypothetical protein PMAC_002996 [Pneumocystis sp. 'macacae']
MESLKLLEKTVTSWSVEDVVQWLKHINFSQYEKEFQDHESLKEIGILSAGHRLSFLKAIYRIKVDQDILIEPEHYIPISVEMDGFNEYDKLGSNEISKLTQVIRSHDKHLNDFEEEIKVLKKNLSKLQKDITSIFKIIKDFKPFQKSENSAFNSDKLSLNEKFHEKPLQLKTIPTRSQISPIHIDSELDSPIFTAKTKTHRFLTSTIQNNQVLETTRKNSDKIKEDSPVNEENQSPVTFQKSHESIEMFKSFRVGLNDPCRKVLLAALKKYKINSDWKEYALVLYYDNKERYIELNEKPLLLFQKLQKDEKKPKTKIESDTLNTFDNTL